MLLEAQKYETTIKLKGQMLYINTTEIPTSFSVNFTFIINTFLLLLLSDKLTRISKSKGKGVINSAPSRQKLPFDRQVGIRIKKRIKKKLLATQKLAENF